MSELQNELKKLVEQYGKRDVRKACEAIFFEMAKKRKTKKEKEFERIADSLLEAYPGDGVDHLAKKNIVKLLKSGVESDMLFQAVDGYRLKLIARKKADWSIDVQFRYQSHNFFGQKAYWKAFVVKAEG